MVGARSPRRREGDGHATADETPSAAVAVRGKLAAIQGGDLSAPGFVVQQLQSKERIKFRHCERRAHSRFPILFSKPLFSVLLSATERRRFVYVLGTREDGRMRGLHWERAALHRVKLRVGGNYASEVIY